MLVPDAHAVAMIGVIRSLGRAGYPVHACADNAEALGLRSTYAAEATICPPYESTDFVGWLRDYVARHKIVAIAPAEGAMLALRPYFEEFAPLLPVSRDPDIVYAGLSKFDLFHSLLRGDDGSIRRHLPPTRLINKDSPLPDGDELRQLGLPLFIKGDGKYGRGTLDNVVVRAETLDQAHETLARLQKQYSNLLVQGHVPGIGAAVAFLAWEGQIDTGFMNLCLHETPHTGGFCTLRESYRNDAMYAHAEKVVRRLGWQGITMLEYRWDKPSNQFFLIEMNPRFWAALHVALYAGADLPRLLLDRHFGMLSLEEAAASAEYKLGVRCRLTVPGEISYVLSRFRDRTLPLGKRLWPALEFFALFAHPRIQADLYFPGDRRLYWRAWKRLFVTRLRSDPDAKAR